MKVFVNKNDVSKALRILKRKLLQEGLAKELRKKEYFISKSQQKRIDKKAGVKRWEKKQLKIKLTQEKQELQLLTYSKRKG